GGAADVLSRGASGRDVDTVVNRLAEQLAGRRHDQELLPAVIAWELVADLDLDAVCLRAGARDRVDVRVADVDQAFHGFRIGGAAHGERPDREDRAEHQGEDLAAHDRFPPLVSAESMTPRGFTAAELCAPATCCRSSSSGSGACR